MNKPEHEYFMARCLELAKKGGGEVAPNPMVGAVLVHDGKIIGEGFHQKFGEAHAEVNCIHNALKNNADKISSSTLYVSLEPCSHFGKTPPCTGLIIQHKIPRVVIGCNDSFEKVNGSGIEQLKNFGVHMTADVLRDEAIQLNKRFFTFHEKNRPYIILKWAQTNDGFIASNDNHRLYITNGLTNRFVHKWRSEEAAIMIGANTALKDNPLLNNRYWSGKSPLKIVLDPDLRLPSSLKIFNEGKLIIVNTIKEINEGHLQYLKVTKENIFDDLLHRLFISGIQSVLIEGGQKLLQSFIDAGLWDEARVITNIDLNIFAGLRSPILSNAVKIKEEMMGNDRIEYFKHQDNIFISK